VQTTASPDRDQEIPVTQWEYAELRYDSRPILFVARSALLIFLGTRGNSTAFQIAKDTAQGDTSFDDALYRTIVRLGHDGWELAAARTTGGFNVAPQQVSMFFKRPMPSPDTDN
jgi:hypothetical protein